MAIATRDASPSHLLLKIDSVSLLDKCVVDKYESPEFDAGNNKWCWKLVIYPNRHGTEKPGEYVSVYLAISGTTSLRLNWEVNAVFSIFILNQISGIYHHTTGSTRRFFGFKTEWGVPNFMSKEELISPSNGYLINDCCLFGAEVFVINNSNVVTRCLSLKDFKVPYKHAIKISDFSELMKGKNWYSEEFTAGNYEWRIKLNPKGDSGESGRSLSIYLENVTFNSENSDRQRAVKVHFTICMKNQLNSDKNCENSGSNWFDDSSKTWGWLSFIPLDELNAAGGEFIMNDACIFEIEISVLTVAQ